VKCYTVKRVNPESINASTLLLFLAIIETHSSFLFCNCFESSSLLHGEDDNIPVGKFNFHILHLNQNAINASTRLLKMEEFLDRQPNIAII